jgi:hypothetical protein
MRGELIRMIRLGGLSVRKLERTGGRFRGFLGGEDFETQRHRETQRSSWVK